MPLRICFGSCRAGIPPGDPLGVIEGEDALRLFAEDMVRTAAAEHQRWPRLFLFTGDQIYGDGPFSTTLGSAFKCGGSAAMSNPAKCIVCGKCISSPSPRNSVTPPKPTNFDEYAAIYREAWTATPLVRWALSCIPSFMIYDDHEIIDDWNISADWVRAADTPGWRRRISDGLLAYWVYQGAGNLSPKHWPTDPRMRPLAMLYPAVAPNATHQLGSTFDRLVRGSTRERWLYAIDIADTRLVVGDTRMSRKLTGRRLLMDDETWNDYVALAKDTRSRKVVLVVPGPVLVPHPMHDLLSRAAESIEGNPASGLGAIVGGIVGGLIAGPPGVVVGALAGAVGSEVVIDRFMPALIEFADAELWSAFPSSFNRMLSLLEDLADGRGTTRKRFICLIGGDVHHSNLIRGDLLRTHRPTSVLNFTMSPIRRTVSPDDQDTLRMLDGGTWYIDLLRAIERPSFVDAQMQRLDWYPIRLDGSRPDASALDEWDFFGQFLGLIDLESHAVSYRYIAAKRSGGKGRFTDLGGARVTVV
ncbi:MAG: hypothetical protein NT002_13800 [candidate division Zixibacteria bacterium]|nr:hypothetical protein [candidate division Zixibacteria bacterium]